MSSWMTVALAVFDVYAVCLLIVGWAINTAPLVPPSNDC
jgi:hypothetical protein